MPINALKLRSVSLLKLVNAPNLSIKENLFCFSCLVGNGTARFPAGLLGTLDAGWCFQAQAAPQMMNFIDLTMMWAQHAEISTSNLSHLESESPQDVFVIYGFRQSESTACPAAKVSTCGRTEKGMDILVFLFIYLLSWAPCRYCNSQL